MGDAVHQTQELHSRSKARKILSAEVREIAIHGRDKEITTSNLAIRITIDPTIRIIVNGAMDNNLVTRIILNLASGIVDNSPATGIIPFRSGDKEIAVNSPGIETIIRSGYKTGTLLTTTIRCGRSIQMVKTEYAMRQRDTIIVLNGNLLDSFQGNPHLFQG